MSTASRITAYLATGRNADLPELVRAWIAGGEGEAADEITDIVSSERTGHYGCECCTKMETSRVFIVDFAASETNHAATVDAFVCELCAPDWDAAIEAVEARS